jgi:hypothetical protein
MTEQNPPVDTFELLRARPDDPPNIRLLRRAVLAMGVLLVAGFGLLVARVVYLALRSPVPAAQPALVTAAPFQAAQPIAAEMRLALPPGAKVRSQSISGNRLSVHYETASGEGIIILDLESGRPASHVRLSAEK